MHDERHVYIGPIWVCAPTMNTHQHTRRICMNEACSNYNKPGGAYLPFCGHCGHRYTDQHYTSESAQQSQRDIISKCRRYNDVYFSLDRPFDAPEKQHIFIVNEFYQTDWTFHLDTGAFTIHTLYNTAEQQEIMQYFREETDLLYANYTTVLVHWGALEWYEEVDE